MKKLLGCRLDAATDHKGINLVTDNSRELARLAYKLVCNSVNIALVMIDVNAYAVPLGLINGGGHILNEVYETAALLNAELTHLAGRGYVDIVTLIGDSTEGADLNERFCCLGGHFCLINN